MWSIGTAEPEGCVHEVSYSIVLEKDDWGSSSCMYELCQISGSRILLLLIPAMNA